MVHNVYSSLLTTVVVEKATITNKQNQARVQGLGPRGPDPPLLQLMVAFIHMY